MNENEYEALNRILIRLEQLQFMAERYGCDDGKRMLDQRVRSMFEHENLNEDMQTMQEAIDKWNAK